MTSPFIVSLSGPRVSVDERALFERLQPAGYILFARNVESPTQVKELCAELATLQPFQTPLIFIDQEGGRVNRIKWESYMAPAPQVIGRLFEMDEQKGRRAAYLNAYLLAAQLRAYGITVDCFPLADLEIEGTDPVIGDRAFSTNPHVVAELCKHSIQGLIAGGCWPIIKHAPGHGRARADSHKELPIINTPLAELENSDFIPFKANADCPFIMTAHILYPELDKTCCATNSAPVLNEILRGRLGMSGLIVSDDLNMQALTGNMQERAQNALDAGCELLLHCSGDFAEMEQLAKMNAPLPPQAADKLNNLPDLGQSSSVDMQEAQAEMKSLLPA